MGAALNDSWNAVLAITPPVARARIGDLCPVDSAGSFLDFAIEAADSDAAAGKSGPASALLLETGVAVQFITKPDLCPLEKAAKLAGAWSRFEATLDVKIIHAVAGSVEPDRVMRALELIDAISNCRRLVIPLLKFARASDTRIRSKALKLMARASQNGAWMDSILSDKDPRVRSNVIEGLFAQMGKDAEPLLRRAAKDPHHRVCTTALLCLAQLGDASSRSKLEDLTGDGREMHARAANWAPAKLNEPNPSSTAPHPNA